MSKEENAENIERAAKTVQITGRVSQAVKDEFDQLRESGGYETFSLFMEALLERYNNPLKVNKENAAKVVELDEKIKKYENMLSDGAEKYNRMSESFNELRAEHNAALAKIEQLEHDNAEQRQSLNEYDTLKTSINGCISVPVSDLEMKCLKFMADRECRLRKRNDITPAIFFMYAVKEMLIKGNKFAIDSVPDSVIAKFKQEIANGQ